MRYIPVLALTAMFVGWSALALAVELVPLNVRPVLVQLQLRTLDREFRVTGTPGISSSFLEETFAVPDGVTGTVVATVTILDDRIRIDWSTTVTENNSAAGLQHSGTAPRELR